MAGASVRRSSLTMVGSGGVTLESLADVRAGPDSRPPSSEWMGDGRRRWPGLTILPDRPDFRVPEPEEAPAQWPRSRSFCLDDGLDGLVRAILTSSLRSGLPFRQEWLRCVDRESGLDSAILAGMALFRRFFEALDGFPAQAIGSPWDHRGSCFIHPRRGSLAMSELDPLITGLARIPRRIPKVVTDALPSIPDAAHPASNMHEKVHDEPIAYFGPSAALPKKFGGLILQPILCCRHCEFANTMTRIFRLGRTGKRSETMIQNPGLLYVSVLFVVNEPARRAVGGLVDRMSIVPGPGTENPEPRSRLEPAAPAE